ncbi:MAG: helix-turn-helix domain-containing protein, partial [Acidobacteriota bacterium]|nr:helix-turn-helix domain-containing protein [Acidobacteriota bacterium]
MAPIDSYETRRFALATAASRFLMDAIPIRPESRDALDLFAGRLNDSALYSPDIDTVAIRCLTVLQRRCTNVPGLVDRFIQLQSELAEPGQRFRQCVESVIEARVFASIDMQRISAFIHCEYAKALTADSIGKALGIPAAQVRRLTRLHARTAVSGALRNVRLDRAADRLLRTRASVKEVWSGVGYNDGSNFTHDFRTRFGVSPTDYRARSPVSIDVPCGPSPADLKTPARKSTIVMIVDDDAGMRETIGRHLRSSGFNVISAATGSEGIRAASGMAIDVGLVD